MISGPSIIKWRLGLLDQGFYFILFYEGVGAIYKETIDTIHLGNSELRFTRRNQRFQGLPRVPDIMEQVLKANSEVCASYGYKRSI